MPSGSGWSATRLMPCMAAQSRLREPELFTIATSLGAPVSLQPNFTTTTPDGDGCPGNICGWGSFWSSSAETRVDHAASVPASGVAGWPVGGDAKDDVASRAAPLSIIDSAHFMDLLPNE